MNKISVPFMLGFGVVLAVIIGQRMSTDAMAVVLGVAVGVAASVPTSLLLVTMLRRQRSDALSGWRPEAGPTQPQLQQPPVIVVNPGQWLPPGQAPEPLPPPGFPAPQNLMSGQHHIVVVGDESADRGGRGW